MRTLQEKYNAVLEGNFSKAQFKRDAAIEMPQFVSTINSFDDTVSILKNKGTLTEAKKDEKYFEARAVDHIAPDVLDTGIKFELDKKFDTLDVSEEDYEKAKETAVKNLTKDRAYYSKEIGEQLPTPGEKMEKVKLNEGEWKDQGQSQELNKERLVDLKNKKAEAEKKDAPAGIVAAIDKQIKELEAILNEGSAEDKYYDDLAAKKKEEEEFRHDSAQAEYEKIDSSLEEEVSLKTRIAGLTNELLASNPDKPEVLAFAVQVKGDLKSGDSSRLAKYEKVHTMEDLEKLIVSDLTEEASPNELYAIHKYLKERLDKKAVEDGDRMSYFSAEYPLASAFAKDIERVLQGPVNESDYDSESKGEGLAELRNILEELGGLSRQAYDVMKVFFPTYLRRAEAYGALDFGTSPNRYDTTLESIIDEIEQDEDSLSEIDNSDHAMRVRAMKNRKPSAPKANPNAGKIAKLKQHRAQIMRDMEQEAEMEGGPVADRYGDMLDKVDRAIAQLSENSIHSTEVEFILPIMHDKLGHPTERPAQSEIIDAAYQALEDWYPGEEVDVHHVEQLEKAYYADFDELVANTPDHSDHEMYENKKKDLKEMFKKIIAKIITEEAGDTSDLMNIAQALHRGFSEKGAIAAAVGADGKTLAGNVGAAQVVITLKDDHIILKAKTSSAGDSSQATARQVEDALEDIRTSANNFQVKDTTKSLPGEFTAVIISK